MSAAHLGVLESFRRDPLPKLEIYRVKKRQAPIRPEGPRILAVEFDTHCRTGA